MATKRKSIPLEHIRGLVVAQGGRCAITGTPLHPHEVNADHIVPLSRRDLAPSVGADNVWLLSKRVNAAKGALTYEEFVELAKQVVAHEERSRTLLAEISRGSIDPVSKTDFEEWVELNCDSDGRVIDGTDKDHNE